MKRLLLVDTSALFHRSHNALTRATGGMTNSSGMAVTGTYGFLSALFSVLGKTEYTCVIPCAEGGGNWRKRESTEYKGNREGKDDSFYADLSLLLEEALPALGMTVVKAPNYEADDVIAHIARNSPAYDEIHILTCDNDLLQLVNNKVKALLFSSAKKMDLFGIDEVLGKFGVFPPEIKYYKALAGDSSDNVAGIKGIGPKTAVRIIEESRPNEINPEFSGADKIALHPKVRDSAATFLANLRLVTLDNDIPDLRWFASSPPSRTQVAALFEALEFRSMTKRLPKILTVLGCDT
jgi:DNA polymerase-1